MAAVPPRFTSSTRMLPPRGSRNGVPRTFSFVAAKVKGLRCSGSGAGRALLGPRHRNSKTGKLCSGMWLRFKDWYLQ